MWPVWNAALFVCYNRTAAVDGMFSISLDLLEKR